MRSPLLTMCRYKALVKALWVFIGLNCFFVALGDAQVLVLEPSQKEWMIERNYNDQYYDDAGLLIIDEEKVPWKRPETNGVQYGYRAGAAWVRFTLKNNHEKERRFVLYFKKPISDVLLYSLFNGAMQQEASVKRHDSIWQKIIPSRLPAVGFTMKPNETRTFLVRVSAVPLSSAFYLTDDVHFTVWQQTETFTLSAFIGLLIGTILFNILLYFFVRDKIYPIYCLYAFFMLSFLATDKNVLQYIYRDFITIKQNSLYLVDLYVITAMSFRFLLTAEFLTILNQYKIFNILARVFFLTGGLLIFLDWFLLPPVIRGICTITFALTVSLVIVIMLVIALFKKSREAYLYLLAFCAPLGGGFAMVLMRFGVLPYNILLENGLLAGVVLEAVFLSACLGDRINILKKEKEEVQMRGLQELGRLAVQLGDRLNTPLNVIQMCAEEIMEEGEDEYIQTESLRIISQVTHISQEMSHLKALRVYAPKDALLNEDNKEEPLPAKA